MKIVDAGYEIFDPIDGSNTLKKIERVARVCYKSEDKITPDSYRKMVGALVKSKHFAMLEHGEVILEVDPHTYEDLRWVLSELSERCGEAPMLRFTSLKLSQRDIVSGNMRAEKTYNYLISEGRTPQEARSVLPNSLKTEVVMTANLREWRHFLSLRACGSTGKPHPQMLEVAVPLLKELRERVPAVFDDLEPMEWETVK